MSFFYRFFLAVNSCVVDNTQKKKYKGIGRNEPQEAILLTTRTIFSLHLQRCYTFSSSQSQKKERDLFQKFVD